MAPLAVLARFQNDQEGTVEGQLSCLGGDGAETRPLRNGQAPQKSPTEQPLAMPSDFHLSAGVTLNLKSRRHERMLCVAVLASSESSDVGRLKQERQSDGRSTFR